MHLTFVGIDPNTKGEDCPAVWVDHQELNFVFQGWKAGQETRAKTQQKSPLPETEDVVLIPARMLPIIKTACEEMERAMANEEGRGGAVVR